MVPPNLGKDPSEARAHEQILILHGLLNLHERHPINVCKTGAAMKTASFKTSVMCAIHQNILADKST